MIYNKLIKTINNQRQNEMKTVTRYQIMNFTGTDFSRAMSSKLRERSQALKLVKRLKKLGHKNAFISAIKINV
jgi:hypothetical protein